MGIQEPVNRPLLCKLCINQLYANRTNNFPAEHGQRTHGMSRLTELWCYGGNKGGASWTKIVLAKQRWC